jgi:NADPH2:quinone reductase
VIPHQDGAGVIDAIGEGVNPARIGERVWLYEAQTGKPDGTAAEYVVVAAEQAVPLPPAASFETGASLGVPALTAHRCLFADGPLARRRVLVQGAGMVGEAAIQLAKWGGAWVAATVRKPEDREVARRAGADLVINMREQDYAVAIQAATGGAGVDRIVEVNLLANLERDLACLSRDGVISTYAAGSAEDVIPLPLLKAMMGGATFRFVYVYSMPAQAKRDAVLAITSCLAQGRYRPTIGASVPLAEIAHAHALQEQRQLRGKILLTLQPASDA